MHVVAKVICDARDMLVKDVEVVNVVQGKVRKGTFGGMELGPRCAFLAKLDAASWLPSATQLRKQTLQPKLYNPKWCGDHIYGA